MLQMTLIGNIGANALVQNSDGREFVTFRVAHNDTYTQSDGQKVSRTMWIDCVMGCSNGRPPVLPYLLAGTLVCVQGSVSTRVYSSEKDRCMKAGLTIHVSKVDLLSSSGDVVPKRLYTHDGALVEVAKYYHVQSNDPVLLDAKGKQYVVADGGWVAPQPDGTANSTTNGGVSNEEPKIF